MVHTTHPEDADIIAALHDLAARRSPGTFCPSDVARLLADDWRPLMPRVRCLAKEAGLKATQKGVDVDPLTARGPIRLGKSA